MNQSIFPRALALALALAAGAAAPAGAVTLSMSPAVQTVDTWDVFSVELVLSDLDVAGGEAVAAFDVDLLYDPAQMELLDWSLGTLLGAIPGDALDISFGDPTGAGVIDLAELSLLGPAGLRALQTAPSFVLATLDFRGLRPGISTIAVDAADPFLDVFGPGASVLPVAVGSDASITQVPAPAPLLLLAAGIAGLGLTRRRDGAAR